MKRIDPTQIAKAILAAPGWARVGITAPSPVMRDDAADEMARVILNHIEQPPMETDERQIGLAL
ncbi:hypothetical protein EOE18_12730 [Novosphingobium umbonatum]|uniref:Uncharacterized protein n=1 Tax=Novosphingobium umbonatum TaxID=1908524 RepID=A0A3S2UQ47_9SPHN|nr:DUF6771 family protein [Novosphingobium umbonatum]RVU04042.1 hypothetical protein EOE18_12730 [Novosphingobium umbonatum]